ncbi:MAG: SDR family oxidoreductase [Burkholderiales bacterium]|nr:SDR family oxidoreductase [Burkholderiales bacterium]
MARLLNKVAVVTGAAHGIGAATAALFAREGAAVALLDADGNAAERLADDIRAAGYRAQAWPVDVSREDEVRTVLHAAVTSFGRIDILVNGAAIAGHGAPTHLHDEADWDRVMAVNVKGTLFCTKHALPYLQASGAGSVIHLASIWSLIGHGDWPAYHASKAALRQMARNDAVGYGVDGVRVNSVHPGFVKTAALEAWAHQTGDAERFYRELIARHPLNRLGEVEDVAYAVLFLASDESRFVTGTELVVDGGYTAQ